MVHVARPIEVMRKRKQRPFWSTCSARCWVPWIEWSDH